uniref:Arginine--tRNA ligase n=1 Tax=Candidatus Aschnera chinzeii TaxID=1485666 RepID=A0AAT9G3P5_9ENTR|nr:MAG: arginine--tRNA ligase [Candidatus Aschnera chinzeii]
MNIQKIIYEKVINIIECLGIYDNKSIVVCNSIKSHFGDYQINGIISIAKKKNISVNELTKQISYFLYLEDFVNKIDILESGYVNIFLKKDWICYNLEKILKDKYLCVRIKNKQTIIVDYSSPNAAKQMHVGHLRSTIIGDAVVRALEFLGHKVIRANHIGDWGTQFGMLIAYIDTIERTYSTNISLSNLDEIYRKAKKYYDNNEEFANISRKYVVKLQSGDNHCRNIWRMLMNISIKNNQYIYDKLNVTLNIKDIYGESYYNNMLNFIVNDLLEKGLAFKDNGAVVVNLDEFKNKNGKPFGVIIKKNDGGFLYSTIDIACIKYRYESLHADRIIYFTDSRQQQHLLQIYYIALKAGYIPHSLKLEHYMFGMILDKNKKPFKTRDGNVILLDELLCEAIKRTKIFLNQKNSNIPKNKLHLIVNAIAIGALKYSDLSKNRINNYIFDWNKMLTFEGNTAPYIQYMYVRIVSLFRKSKINPLQLITPIILLNHYEYKLALCILQFEENLLKVTDFGLPHILCNYLYKLASLFAIFYENCPILNVNNKEIQNSRLKLSFVTKKTLKIGLNILGIHTVEIM